jgi:hypothetical protein
MPRLIFLTIALPLLILGGASRPAEAITLTVEQQGGWSCCPLDLRTFGSFSTSCQRRRK